VGWRRNQKIRHVAQSNVAVDMNAIFAQRQSYKEYSRRNGKIVERSTTTQVDNDNKSAVDEARIAIGAYRKELRKCIENTCDCVCKCHTGGSCDVEDGIARYHTQNHKQQSRVTYKCNNRFIGRACTHTDNMLHTRERVEVGCHDTIMSEKVMRRFHMRKV
jgi:hypothetical protein